MDWYKDWTKNENEKKKEKPSENLDNYCSRPVKAELPKVGGGQTLGH